MSLWKKWRPTAPRASALVGVVLIVAGVVVTGLIVRANNAGRPVIIAAEYLPAGTVITADSVVEVHVTGPGTIESRTLADVIGHTVAIPVGAGEIVSTRIEETTPEERVTLAIPLGFPIARGVNEGSRMTLWRIDDDGVLPPTTIAESATLLEREQGAFGADEMATVLLDPFDVDRVLAALGSTQIIVATTGSAP